MVRGASSFFSGLQQAVDGADRLNDGATSADAGAARVLPAFFQAIAPFMPMTYLIDAYWVVISGARGPAPAAVRPPRPEPAPGLPLTAP